MTQPKPAKGETVENTLCLMLRTKSVSACVLAACQRYKRKYGVDAKAIYINIKLQKQFEEEMYKLQVNLLPIATHNIFWFFESPITSNHFPESNYVIVGDADRKQWESL